MRTLGPTEVLKDRIDTLGEEAGRFLYNLENDLYQLRIHWRVYNSFFGTNQERVDLFNRCSGIVAFCVEKTMLESAMLSVCRMTDPQKLRKSSDRNITVKRLPDYLSRGADSELANRIDDAVKKTAFARSHRNKRLAHADDDVRNGKATVDDASRRLMKDAIDAVASCIRRFAIVELEVSLDTHPLAHYSGDEIEFLKILSLGLKKLGENEATAQKFRENRNWNELRSLEESPSWLTFRPADEHDAE